MHCTSTSLHHFDMKLNNIHTHIAQFTMAVISNHVPLLQMYFPNVFWIAATCFTCTVHIVWSLLRLSYMSRRYKDVDIHLIRHDWQLDSSPFLASLLNMYSVLFNNFPHLFAFLSRKQIVDVFVCIRVGTFLCVFLQIVWNVCVHFPVIRTFVCVVLFCGVTGRMSWAHVMTAIRIRIHKTLSAWYDRQSMYGVLREGSLKGQVDLTIKCLLHEVSILSIPTLGILQMG